jgi:hypothetical protein
MYIYIYTVMRFLHVTGTERRSETSIPLHRLHYICSVGGYFIYIYTYIRQYRHGEEVGNLHTAVLAGNNVELFAFELRGRTQQVSYLFSYIIGGHYTHTHTHTHTHKKK